MPPALQPRQTRHARENAAPFPASSSAQKPSTTFTKSHQYSSSSFHDRLRAGLRDRDPERAKRVKAARERKATRKAAKDAAGKDGKAKKKNRTKPAMLEFDLPPGPADVDAEETAASSSKIRSFHLPRFLARRDIAEDELGVNAELLLSVAPEFASEGTEGTTLEPGQLAYIRDVMKELGPGLLRTVASASVEDMSKTTLVPDMVLRLNDQGSDYPPPTVLLAVYRTPSTSPSTTATQVVLLPAHTNVLALYCSRIPTLPPTPPVPAHVVDSESGTLDPSRVRVPVQPLRLPSPSTFPQLLSFLYTKRADNLSKALLPPGPMSATVNAASSTRAQATLLAQTYTSQALLKHAMDVHGLWSNATVLGIDDDPLWEVIENTWEILMWSLALSVGRPGIMAVSEDVPPEASADGKVGQSSRGE
ncbi:unnamed protein product [Mycena citricolor]|uniref:Clp1-like protein n=1 Tax=Mycena citricolor TaxID=2018698 RepID=A0AAD2HIY3_9AGAR|nr:unnamed protein product [Mycena citricolor]CAK5276667.1 unnamed protein product [Mycena citricolor]